MIIDELIAILGYDVQGEGELRRFNDGLTQAERKAHAVANRINAMSVAIGTFVGQMAVDLARGLGRTIGSIPGDILDVGRQFENLETVLTTIEGSSDKAKASMDWVQEFAETTPYDLQQVSEAFVRMRAYGLDPMSGQLKSIGDAAAGMGKGLMQGVEAIADAVTGENERLKEFGIKTKVEGDKITYNWNENGKEMSKTVRKNGTEIIAALMEIFGRFDGAMENLSKTQEGILGNLGDKWTGFLKQIGEAGYYDDVTRRLKGVQEMIERWDRDGIIDRVARGFSRFLTGAMNFGSQAGKALWDIGRAAYYTADALVTLVSRVTGLNKAASAGILGAALLGSTRMGRAAMMALAKRMPMLGALLLVEDIMSGLRGDDSYIANLEGGSEALEAVREKFAALHDALQKLSEQFDLGLDWSAIASPGDFINDALVSFIRDLANEIERLTKAVNALREGNIWDAIKGAFGVEFTPGGLAERVFGPDVAPPADLSIKQEKKPRASSAQAPLEPAMRWIDETIFGGILSSDKQSGVDAKEGRFGTLDQRRFNSDVPVVRNGDALRQALENFRGNMAKMSPDVATEAVLNDNSVANDNRDQSVTVGGSNVTVNVQQATQAPAAAGKAVGDAVSRGAMNAVRSNAVTGTTGVAP